MKCLFMLFLLITSMALTASSCFGIPNFTIMGANIEQIDWNSFRLNVDVSWEYWDDYFAPDYINGQETHKYNSFSSFSMTPMLGTNQEFSAGWAGEGQVDWMAYGGWDDLGTNFWYEFDLTEGLGYKPITISYDAGFEYWIHWREQGLYDSWAPYGGHRFGGTFFVAPPAGAAHAATIAPEPSSVVLLGLGLTGAGIVRRFKK